MQPDQINTPTTTTPTQPIGPINSVDGIIQQPAGVTQPTTTVQTPVVTPQPTTTQPIAPASTSPAIPDQNLVGHDATDATAPSAELSPAEPTIQPVSPLVTQPTVAEISASPAITNQVYSDICTHIIREQQNIIGSLAIDQAELVEGLTTHRTPNGLLCQVNGDGLKVIDELISQYQDFFGHAAVEVCKEAASQLIMKLPPTQVPVSLR